jgi:hypothetical protein
MKHELHGCAGAGGSKATPEYLAYRNAKARCNNRRDKGWKNYGGRGIKFLFSSFKQFLAEIGRRPEGKVLDRRENNGNYAPGNVRWVTYRTQLRNRRPFTARGRFSKPL